MDSHILASCRLQRFLWEHVGCGGYGRDIYFVAVATLVMVGSGTHIRKDG